MAANEFLHKDPGSVLTQNEYIASPGSSGGHTLGANQAVGDLIYASTAYGAADGGIIRRLAIGTSGQYLTVAGGIPAWSSTLTGTVITATTNFTIGDTVITDGVITDSTGLSIAAVVSLGANAFTTTGLISGGSLDIDDVLINGATIGHTDDTDLMTLANGALTVAGTFTASGVVTASGLTIGSAVIVESELETIDDVTAGTVAASKAVVVDANLDIASFRNLTATGVIAADSLDIDDGGVDVNGTLEANAYTVAGTALDEFIQDTVGAMFTSNTETRIAVTYDDSDGTIDLVVDDMTGAGSITDVTSLYHASLKVGHSDTDANIDFSTDNTIFFDIDGNQQVKLVDGILQPVADSDVDLGTTGERWKDAFIDTITTTGNVTVGGDLTVNGTTTTVDTTTLSVKDPLIALATGNDSADALDIGIYGLYDTSGSQDLYAGLFRDANDSGKWKLFKDNQAAPTTTVNTSGTGYAVGTLVATLEGNADTVTTNANLTGDVTSSGNATTIASGAVDEAHIADNQVTLAKMAGIARGKIIYGDASGDPAVLASGDAGEVLTMTDGDDFDWAAAAGGATQTFEAKGAISTGDYVSLNSNGTVSTSVGPVTAPVDFESAATYYGGGCYDVDQNRVVLAYQDDANSDYGTAIVGTVSGGAITFGTPVIFESGTTTYPSASYDEVVNKVVISYVDQSNSYYGTAIVGEVDDDAISFGTAALFNSGYTYFVTSVFAPDGNNPASDTAADGRVVIAYLNASNNNYGTAVVAEAAADDTIAFGTPVVFESASIWSWTNMESMAYDPDTNRVVIAYNDAGDSNHGRAVVGEISDADNNVIEFGTPVEFEAAAVSYTSVAYDTNVNKMVISYRDGGDGNSGKGIVGTVTGGETNSIAFNGSATAYDTHTSSYYHAITFDPNEDKVMVLWKDYDGTIENAGTYTLGTISGDEISWGDEVVFNYASTNYIGAVYDPDSELMVISYLDGGDSNHGKCVLIDSSTENNFLGWVGIAGTGVADGENVEVNVLGTVNEDQSGLTIGTKYYMQNNGTVNTNSVTNRQVGIATATTKMFVTAGSIS